MKLRPFQNRALQNIAQNSHLILTAPTGAGKSMVIYQAHIQQFKRTLLISPLIALTRQHSYEIRQLNVNVFGKHFASAAHPHQDQTGIWILSPESLQHQIQKISEWDPDFIVVDEAHCIWEWSDDFRREFRQVLDLPRKFPSAKTLWCSATLHFDARQQIQECLPKAAIEQGGFQVPENVDIQVEELPMVERLQKIYEKVQSNTKGSTLLFASTRKLAEHLGRWADRNKIKNVVYHAGLSQEERIHIENKILLQPPPLIIATSAFGMGVNFLFINQVILAQPPYTLLSLAQAVGRAGRSGQNSAAFVYWHPEDFYEFMWATRDSLDQGLSIAQVESWCRTEGNKTNLLELYFSSPSLHSPPYLC